MTRDQNEKFYYSSAGDNVVLNGLQPQSQGMKKPEGKWDQLLTKPFYVVVCYTLVLMIAMEFVGLNEKFYILVAILVGWIIVVWNNVALFVWFFLVYMICLLQMGIGFVTSKKRGYQTREEDNLITNFFISFMVTFLILVCRRMQVSKKEQKREDEFFEEVLKHSGPYEKMRRNVSIIFASKIINIDHRDQSREEIVKDMAIIMSGSHTPYFFDIDNKLHRIRHRHGIDEAVKVANLSQEVQNVIEYRGTTFEAFQPSMV